jgi:hypothetical protein
MECPQAESTLEEYLRKTTILHRHFKQLGIIFPSFYETLCLMAPLKKVNEIFYSQF